MDNASYFISPLSIISADVSVGFSQDYIVMYENENPPEVFVQVFEGALKREIRVNIVKLNFSEYYYVNCH